MVTVDPAIQSYIQANVLPKYKQNDKGHGMEHINFLISDKERFVQKYKEINGFFSPQN